MLKYENPIDFTLTQHETLLTSLHMAKFSDLPTGCSWFGTSFRENSGRSNKKREH